MKPLTIVGLVFVGAAAVLGGLAYLVTRPLPIGDAWSPAREPDITSAAPPEAAVPPGDHQTPEEQPQS